MKNLKKLVSVIVTVAMLISSLAALSVSAAYPDVDESNSYAKAIEVLSGLGIVKGDDEGNFNPTNDIKRSEMVALICRMKGEEGIATSTVQEFNDVPSNHWAAGYISWGVASEIIKGYGDGNFGPDASVTLQDAVVMIIRAAGWERIANRSDYGGYPTGHMRIANARGVMDGISFTATKAATREVVAQAIYNGMTMPLVEYISFGENADDDRYAIYDGRATGYELATLLTNTNRIYKVKADVTKTAKSDVTLKTDAGDKVALKITGNYDYTDMHADLALNATPAPYVGESNIADFLGCTVEAYLVKKGSDWTVLVAVADDSTESLTLKASEVDFDTYGSDKFNYYATSTATRTTALDIATAPVVYYNGKVILDTANSINNVSVVATDLEDLLVNKADVITFMGDKNAAYSKIFVTDYAYAQVEKVKAEELYIDLVTGAISLDAEERNYEKFAYNIYDAEGKAMDIADIQEDDILNIVAPLTASNTFDLDTVESMDIYVTNKVVTGSVDEEIVANAKYKINGEIYKLESNAVGSVATGDEGTYFLTIDGLVYACDAGSVIEKNYAFIVASHKDTAFGQNTFKVQLFTAEGKVETVTVASTLKVWTDASSTTYKTSDGTLTTYMDGAFNNKIKDETTQNAAAAKLAGRIITYSLNSAGELKEIRFAATSGTKFISTAISSGRYYDDTQVFANFDLDDNSKIFIAPVTGSSTTWNVDKEDLEMASFSAMDEEARYSGTAFNFDNDDYLGALILNAPITSSMKKAHLATVKLSSTALDAEQNTVAKYTFVQGGEIVELTVDSDASVTTLSIGDVFRYTVNEENEIDDIQLVYDASTTAFNDQGLEYQLLSTNDIALVYGKITEVKNGKMVINATYNDDNDDGTTPEVAMPKLTLNETEGNTYASIDETTLGGSNPQNAVKALTSVASLKESYGSQDYYVVAIVGETNRFEDCVMIIK